MEQIKFKNLSGWLKALVILGWINFGIMMFYFMIGLIVGTLEYMYI